jgi:hypothetical protein
MKVIAYPERAETTFVSQNSVFEELIRLILLNASPVSTL